MTESTNSQRTVWDVLGSVSFSFKVGEDAERVDKEYLKILHDGQAEKNLNKIYEFIDMAERGSQPQGDSSLPKIIEDAYEIDPVRLFRFIEAKNDLVSYWTFLSMICNKEILFSFADMESDDPLLHFECARQILTRFSYNDGYESPCVNAVIRFAAKDIALWNSWIKKYEHNPKWAKITWSVLQKLKTKELIEYSENISLITCYLNTTGDLLEDGFHSIDVAKMDQIISTIAQTIYARWEEALITSKRNGRFQNNILISNYISILLPSMDFLFSDSKLWIEQFQKYVSLLNSDSHKWYSSETNYSSSFFLNLSNIYYLIVIRKDIQELLGHDDIRASVDTIKFLLSKYESFWKFNDSASRINHINDLLNV